MNSNYDNENRLWYFMTAEEEHAYYNEVLDRVIANPRYYLDNLDTLFTFRVSFRKYKAEFKDLKDTKSKDL